MQTGLAISVGPSVSALIGILAGRPVDRFGVAGVVLTVWLGVVLGSVLMTLLTGAFGVVGFIGSLAIIKAGYALFQAANTAVVMNGATVAARGVTSAFLRLSKNLGLITEASAMGPVFAFGSRSGWLGAAGEAGLRPTFAVASVVAIVALCVALFGRKHRPVHRG